MKTNYLSSSNMFISQRNIPLVYVCFVLLNVCYRESSSLGGLKYEVLVTL